MTQENLSRDIESELALMFEHLLQQEPDEQNLKDFADAARARNLSTIDLFKWMIDSPDYRKRPKKAPGHPIGHYYSPIIDTEELRGYFAPQRQIDIEELAGLNLTKAAIRATFDRMRPFIGTHTFSEHQNETDRFYWNNGGFPLGDAVFLSAIIQMTRPRRIIEIGSGHSTACMLDTIERAGLETTITCVEPYADRLRARLRPEDKERVTIHEVKVQTTDPALYEVLEAGDILFIDSTHVVKTGSDVCFELFEILPRLKPGVLIHFHDIMYPFEYNDTWIFEYRWSWNEIYALRAFLMYNSDFRVVFFNDYCGRAFRQDLDAAYGAPVANPGVGLWIERQA